MTNDFPALLELTIRRSLRSTQKLLAAGEQSAVRKWQLATERISVARTLLWMIANCYLPVPPASPTSQTTHACFRYVWPLQSHFPASSWLLPCVLSLPAFVRP